MSKYGTEKQVYIAPFTVMLQSRRCAGPCGADTGGWKAWRHRWYKVASFEEKIPCLHEAMISARLDKTRRSYVILIPQV